MGKAYLGHKNGTSSTTWNGNWSDGHVGVYYTTFSLPVGMLENSYWQMNQNKLN